MDVAVENKDMDFSAADLRATQSNMIQYSKQHLRNLPPGSITNFEWKDYCPKAFRLIQELENIDNDDYMMSVCSDETIKKVCSLLRPGHLFLLSNNPRFAVKTLRKSEVKVLIEMLPSYYSHLKKYRSTILNKLYGVHVVKPIGGVKAYFVVVENVFKSDLLMHRCYDLKGSLQGRKVEKTRVREKTLHKESDLDFLFYLDPLLRHRLLAQIKNDCAFLEAVGVMNYSLLLGLHVKGSPQGVLDNGTAFSLDQSPRPDPVDRRCSLDNTRNSNKSFHRRSFSSELQRSSISSFQEACADSRCSNTITMVSTDTTFQDKDGAIHELSFGEQWLQNNRYKFGEEMSARGVRIQRNGAGAGAGSNVSLCQDSTSQEWHDVVLYFGIVDFFQDYGVVKRLEHAVKSLQFDSRMIAAVNPKAYSSRFQDFLSDIFKADDESPQ